MKACPCGTLSRGLPLSKEVVRLVGICRMVDFTDNECEGEGGKGEAAISHLTSNS